MTRRPDSSATLKQVIVERAIRGGVEAEQLAAKMANDLDTSKALHKTYAPVDMATARKVDEARRKGRRQGR